MCINSQENFEIKGKICAILFFFRFEVAGFEGEGPQIRTFGAFRRIHIVIRNENFHMNTETFTMILRKSSRMHVDLVNDC